jgi:hypothetical protein
MNEALADLTLQLPSRVDSIVKCRAAWTAMLVAVATGCGGPDTSVKGLVTYEGEPVTRGVITVLPAGGKGKAEGSKILNGVYEIKSIEPGTKQISVMGRMGEETNGQVPVSSDEKMAAFEANSAAEPFDIPMDAAGNGQRIEVKQGAQEINIELGKPATSK